MKSATRNLRPQAVKRWRSSAANWEADNPVTLVQMFGLANVLDALGQKQEAEKLMLETSEHQARVFGADNPQTALSIYTLGVWAARQREKEKAFQLLRQAIEHGLDERKRSGIGTDPDLKSLHDDPRFNALVADTKKRAGAATPKTNELGK